jgi:DNA-binding transcriptional LysR family regulator
MNSNRELFDGMALFCEVVTQGSFAAAAKCFGHTASHVSRAVARLEQRLGVRLLHRTTRRLSLTEPGQVYFDEARRMVEDAKRLEARLGALGDRPFGVLRMSVPVIFARAHFDDWVPEFMARYPEVQLDIEVADRRVDLIADQRDLAVRIGAPGGSSLMMRELFRTRLLTVASPDYLGRAGHPETPFDLEHHRLIDFSFRTGPQAWIYDTGGEEVRVGVTPTARCNDAYLEKALALGGAGITRLPEMACADELKAGSLVNLLQSDPPKTASVMLVWPSRERLAAKVRAMIDFLVEKSGGL